MNSSLTTRKEFLAKAILSISGWRHTFGLNSFLTNTDQEFAITSAFVIGEYLQKINFPVKNKYFVLARDSRVTGKNICEIFLTVFKEYHHFNLYYLDITAIPQVLTFVQAVPNVCGFVYISASHNPAEYNGIKIGNQQGEILPPQAAHELIENYKQNYLDEKKFSYYLESYRKILDNLKYKNKSSSLNNIFLEAEIIKNSQNYYKKFIKKIIVGFDEQKDNQNVFNLLKNNLKPYDLTIFYDYNGSARLNTIDKELLQSLTISVSGFNEKIGHFAHEIIPEGDSLLELKNKMTAALGKISTKSSNILLGVMPDCDGDRGNFVFYNHDEQNNRYAYIPDAQTTFALTVLAEVCYTSVWLPEKFSKMIVIANDPTSLKVNDICENFQVNFVQAEVGEANILALAKEKIAAGYYVRIIGEGSNGGSILLPSRVRDPLVSILSLLKLLFLPSPQKNKTLLDIALEKLNLTFNTAKKETLAGISDFISIEKKLILLCQYLQKYQSTLMGSAAAMIKGEKIEQGKLKANYEKILQNEYREKKEKLAKEYNVYSYQILNYMGTQMTVGPGNRNGYENGGLKVAFLNDDKRQIGFLWMRSSQTEPIYRISAEIRGNQDQQKWLLDWQRTMIKKAIVASK